MRNGTRVEAVGLVRERNGANVTPFIIIIFLNAGSYETSKANSVTRP